MENNPIRILHVVRYLEQGGIQNFLMNLYRNIDTKKIQFDFLVSGEGFFDGEIKSRGGKIYTIPYITDLGVKKYQTELEKFFKEHLEYKIVHCHLNQLSGVVLEVAKKMNILCRIAHAHTTKNTNNILVKIYKSYLQNKINKNATHLFACSEEAAKCMFRKDNKRAVIINNGIQIEKFIFSQEKRNYIRKQLNIEDNTMVIGHVGRFSKVKNQNFLLDIFYEYQKINQNSVLILVGEGQTREKIIEKIKMLRLENKVILVGSQKEIANYYSCFDSFVFPSLFEGLGIVLIEAQVSGLKCFASDKVIPKSTKISENITYIDIDLKPEDWAKQIPLDNFYQETRNNIKIDKEIYDIKKIVKKLEHFYLENCN